MNTHLIDACGRLRAEAETDDYDVVIGKILALAPLLEDMEPWPEQIAAVQVCEEALAILRERETARG